MKIKVKCVPPGWNSRGKVPEVTCDQRVPARVKEEVGAESKEAGSRAGSCRGENAEVQEQNLQKKKTEAKLKTKSAKAGNTQNAWS